MKKMQKDLAVFPWIYTLHGRVENQLQNAREYYFVLHTFFALFVKISNSRLVHGNV